MEDIVGNSCDFDLTTTMSCVDWTQFDWQQCQFFPPSGNCADMNPCGVTFTGFCNNSENTINMEAFNISSFGTPLDGCAAQAFGQITYNGPACNAQVTQSKQLTGGGAFIDFIIFNDATADILFDGGAVGNGTFTFAIPAGPVTLDIFVECQPTTTNPGLAAIQATLELI
jgi:hypothetical protein